jgi:hypothetical protein
MKKYESYDRDELLKMLGKRDEEIEKLKSKIKEKQELLEAKMKIIATLERTNKEYLEIEENAERYSNYKIIEELELREKSYRELFENQKAKNTELITEYQKRLENTRMREHNERGAGRKIQFDLVLCTQLIQDNRELSLRKIQEICNQQGQKISLDMINRLKKES